MATASARGPKEMTQREGPGNTTEGIPCDISWVIPILGLKLDWKESFLGDVEITIIAKEMQGNTPCMFQQTPAVLEYNVP